MYNCILLRYGEIGLKSKRTRPWFEKRYVSSIQDALARGGVAKYKIKNLGGRFVIETDEPTAVKVLQKVAGIQSISPAVYISFESIHDLVSQMTRFGYLLKNKKFGVKVKRVGTHPFTSQDLAKEIANILYPSSDGVDLINPDIRISVEVRGQNAYIFTETYEGVGGLPVDPAHKVLCLFSGGLDSPIAAYQLMKRGCAVDFLFINLGGEKSFFEASRVYNYLIDEYWYGYKPTFYHVNGQKIVQQIKSTVPSRLRQVVLKAAFYQIAEIVGKNHLAFATGESLAQKSSQTLQSLIVLDTFSEKTILRPLIGMDKVEVIRLAKKLGTYSTSTAVVEYCGITQGPVTTEPKKREIEENCISVLDIQWDTYQGVIEIPPEINLIPSDLPLCASEEYIVIDIRDEHIREEMPLKSEGNYSFPEILHQLQEFSIDKKYIIVCTFGVKSDEVAFALKKRGIHAISMDVAMFTKWYPNAVLKA